MQCDYMVVFLSAGSLGPADFVVRDIKVFMGSFLVIDA